jgi:hypothetical protein
LEFYYSKMIIFIDSFPIPSRSLISPVNYLLIFYREVVMETIMVPLWAALQVARWRKKAIPRWKRWRLRNPEKDKAQKKAYYWRNRDKIAVNSRVRYLRKKGANAGDLNE